MVASGSPRSHNEWLEDALGIKLSGILTRAGIPVELVAFCPAGHLTAPDWPVGYKDPPRTCDGAVFGVLCRRDMAYLRDYGVEALAAWVLGGADAAYELIRHQAWPHSSANLEPR